MDGHGNDNHHCGVRRVCRVLGTVLPAHAGLVARPDGGPGGFPAAKTVNDHHWVLTVRDVVLFWRLLKANPTLWFGEYVFHVTFLLVTLRHLRYFMDPVPAWVWDLQLPGLIAGYVLPVSLVYILIVRSCSEREKYSSPANMLLLALLLAISGMGC